MYTEELPADAGIMLFIKDLNQADSGKYVCRGTYANNEEMQTQVVISTFSKYPLYIVQSYIYNIPQNKVALYGHLFHSILFPSRYNLGRCSRRPICRHTQGQ